MRPEAFTTITDTSLPGAGPIHLSQSFGRPLSGAWPTAMAVIAALIALPQLVIAGYIVASAETRTAIIEHPAVALQLAVAVIFWMLLIILPARRVVARLTRQRQLTICNQQVSVVDTFAFSERRWNEPVSAYRGLAHHVRSSLSGCRHELVLVHANPDKTLVLRTDDRIGRDDSLALATRLGVGEADPADMYHLPLKRRRSQVLRKRGHRAGFDTAAHAA